MKVEFIRSRSLTSAGPLGPVTRVFSIGDVVDVDDLQARIFVAQKDAVFPGSKPVKPAAKPVEEVAEKVAEPVVEAAPKPAPAKAKKAR